MIDVLCVPGTGNPTGEPITFAFMDRLDRRKFNPRVVEYPADYGTNMSVAQSAWIGKQNLARAVHESPNECVIAGYSQGALPAGDLAAEYGAGLHPELWIRAVALIADPLRQQGVAWGPDPGGYGVSGQRPIRGLPVYSVAAWGDPITSLPAGNRIRDIADFTEFMSVRDPAAWFHDVADKLRREQWQNALQRPWDRDAWRRTGEAAQWARGYLFDGRHTNAYIDDGHIDRLADAINQIGA